MSAITTIDALRTILAQPRATTKAKILDHLDEQARAFIARSPFMILSTVGNDGLPDASPKGDEPGFVLIEDERSIVIPDRAGNNLAFGLSNIIANPHVGLIMLSPGTGETLRIAGRATLDNDPALCQRLSARGKPALLGIRIAIERAYFHCARSVLRANLWQPDKWPAAMKVSFGTIIAQATKADAALIGQIDAMVDSGYKSGL
jgi:PPOX class probable FMN-dependent enzyme